MNEYFMGELLLPLPWTKPIFDQKLLLSEHSISKPKFLISVCVIQLSCTELLKTFAVNDDNSTGRGMLLPVVCIRTGADFPLLFQSLYIDWPVVSVELLSLKNSIYSLLVLW